jgi:hypothetical protein
MIVPQGSLYGGGGRPRLIQMGATNKDKTQGSMAGQPKLINSQSAETKPSIQMPEPKAGKGKKQGSFYGQPKATQRVRRLASTTNAPNFI